MSQSSTPPPIPASKLRRRRWRSIALVILFVLPGFCALSLLVGYRLANASAVRRLEAAARNRGEPVTLAELARKHPPLQDGENAAVLLVDIWEREQPEFWEAFRLGVRPLPKRAPRPVDSAVPFLGRNSRYLSRTEPLEADVLAAADAYLRTNRTHLDLVRNALAARSHVRFSINITDGLAALLPHLPQMKTEAQSFRVATLVAVERAAIDEAIGALHVTEQIGRALADEPFLISQLVRIACSLMVLQDMERLMSRHSLSEGQLRELSGLLERLRMPGALKNAYIAERATALDAFEMRDATVAAFNSSDDSSEPGITAGETRFGLRLLNSTGIVTGDRRFMLETMENAISLAEKDTPESLAQLEALFDGIADRARRFPPKIISGMLLSSLGKAADKFASLEARRRAGLTAIAVERYRLTHAGRLPVQLDELVPQCLPQVLTDPFDGSPLRLRPLAKGFVVYSIGADRLDNSGQERPRKGKVESFDETFTVAR